MEALRKKETQNWEKCWIALVKTTEVIAKLARDAFDSFYKHVRQTMYSNHGISEQDTCNSCMDLSKLCNLCSKIHFYIWENHRFKTGVHNKNVQRNGPSWNNTDCTNWCTNSWELAKCYMSTTGYKEVQSAGTTDFQGIIGALYNCTWMQRYFTDDLSKADNIITKARDTIKPLRHAHVIETSDTDMIAIFDCFLNILNDPAFVYWCPLADSARTYLGKLQNDSRLLVDQILLEEMKSAFLRVKDKVMLDNINEALTQDKKEEFREMLMKHYLKTLGNVSVSPILEGRDKPIWDIFVSPKLRKVDVKANGSRIVTDNLVHKYKDIVLKSDKICEKVFIQGDPGMGKTTFLNKLVLDWCDENSAANSGHRSTFSDIETLKEFRFIFHIILRDSIDTREVVEMIKTQIIDGIYVGEKKKEVLDLLGLILEQDTCLITLDGLNEWTNHKYATPVIVTGTRNCVMLFTTRPYAMVDRCIKDSEIGILLDLGGVTEPKILMQKIISSQQTDKSYTDFEAYVDTRNLSHLLTSPWLATLLVNLWSNAKYVQGSLCELLVLLIDNLLKKATAQEGFFEEGYPIKCFSNTCYIKPNKEIFDALGKAAFFFTASSKSSRMFTERELRNYFANNFHEQLQFCLKVGLLTAKHNSTILPENKQISFLHETIQEFFAACYIANLEEDILANVLGEIQSGMLEMSQVIVFVCGLNCKIGNKVIQCIGTGKFFEDVSYGVSTYLKGPGSETEFFKSDQDINYDQNCLALSMLFQRMLIASYHEASLNGGLFNLKCEHFVFSEIFNGTELKVLQTLLLKNMSNVRSLILECNILRQTEILNVLQQSKVCLERVKIDSRRVPSTPEIVKELPNLNVKELAFFENNDVSSLFSKLLFSILPTLSHLEFLQLEEVTREECINVPVSLWQLSLKKCTLSSQCIQLLMIRLSSLAKFIIWELNEVNVIRPNSTFAHGQLLSCDMSKVRLIVRKGRKELYEILRNTPLKHLAVETVDDISMASEIFPTLNKLETLFLCGTHTCPIELQFPSSLNTFGLVCCKCSHEWLCSVLMKLTSLAVNVSFVIGIINIELISDNGCEDDSKNNLSEMKSELVLRDWSKITLTVSIDNIELLDILHGLSISVLYIKNFKEKCVTLESGFLTSLGTLNKLILEGYFIDPCEFRMPHSLTQIILMKCECSANWLCNLLMEISSFDHNVQCVLNDFVLQSYEEQNKYTSKIGASRSNMLSCNISNILLCVINCSIELFEIFRETNILNLSLCTPKTFALASEILPTLRYLSMLYLKGSCYTGQCTVQVPSSLRVVSLMAIECETEWLCSLLIRLSSLGQRIECEITAMTLHKSVESRTTDRSVDTRVFRTKLLSCNMTNIAISVTNGSTDLFEILRNTSIARLLLRQAGEMLLTSNILTTLNNLNSLFFIETYMGRCNLKLPSKLRIIHLSNCKCSTDWLSRFLLTIASLGHPVTCNLTDLIFQNDFVYADACKTDSQVHDSNFRSKALAISNINIIVMNGKIELYEILRDSNIEKMNLETADDVSLAANILPSLRKLKYLRLSGFYKGQCNFQLPISLEVIVIDKVKFTTVWLSSLFETISSFDHAVFLNLYDFELHPNEDACEMYMHVQTADVQSEMSCDLTNVSLFVTQGSIELFKMLSNTNLVKMGLHADCVLLGSTILPTLKYLKMLHLEGNYDGCFYLQLPVSLQRILLKNGKCSPEWLCSLFITLSTFQNHVVCVLHDFVVQPCGEDSNADVRKRFSDMRYKLLSSDISHVELQIRNGTLELYTLLRETSLGILKIESADDISMVKDTLPTLTKLKQCFICGTLFNHHLPQTLEVMNSNEASFSIELYRRLPY
ncbi:hypothetical protein DPMN_188820 [Dreissena polymorpha]|uniref:NACHT domain-containing protein n=1 Tax=Dreissena polymorpha TaxID=45954 RepID=A0A9D4DQT8_DREPO|nr:hypothetical protein DPMN_188820 [Dreissena polymorpha]